jgi:hypothetical protein
MGRGSQAAGAAGMGRAQHRDRLVEVARAVVDAGQEVRVDVDEVEAGGTRIGWGIFGQRESPAGLSG